MEFGLECVKKLVRSTVGREYDLGPVREKKNKVTPITKKHDP
jgi:hypothetical protein